MNLKLQKLILITCLIFCILAVPLAIWLYHSKQNLEIDFLNVGQGDAELIKSPFGQNILIDGGPDSSVISQLNNNLPFWDKKIDLVVLTHPHDDHAAGLIKVIKNYEVKNFIYTGAKSADPGYKELTESIREEKIPTKIMTDPMAITLGDNCLLRLLSPWENISGTMPENPNNVSIISMLDCEQEKILFAADAEQELEARLIENRESLKADILKVGHHGSDTSTSEEFINAIKPEWAIIEVGKDNRFGHPSLRILNRLERIGAKILRTDMDGIIKVKVDNGVVSVKY